jgi:hypothetical protein
MTNDEALFRHCLPLASDPRDQKTPPSERMKPTGLYPYCPGMDLGRSGPDRV